MVYRPFQEARIFARCLGLKNKDEWRVWSKSDKRPEDIPANPQQTYADPESTGKESWSS
jgi:hypothetical protein